MIPITQTKVGDQGNCFSACIASILEIPLESIPNFVEEKDWWGSFQKWAKDNNISYIEMSFHQDDATEIVDGTFFHRSDNMKYCILSGKSPRMKQDGTHRYHATVGEITGYGVRMIHDPHPSRDGLLDDGPRWVMFIWRDKYLV